MKNLTHQTAPTQFIEAHGIRFAYRRFGNTASQQPPLIFNQHYTGTMDHWDPSITDGLAKSREVILFNNAGVSSSSGEVPATIQEMAQNAVSFIKALGLKQVDVLGFSMGGMVAQEITVQEPTLVRRLILVGTAPRGGDFTKSRTAEIFSASYATTDDMWIAVHFLSSASSQAAGRAYLKRTSLRSAGRDPEVGEKVATTQFAAIGKNAEKKDGVWDYLKTIKQPTLVVSGSADAIAPTINSYILQQELPNAELVIYPDSGHGSFFQYSELFVRQTEMFLDSNVSTEGAYPLPFPTELANN